MANTFTYSFGTANKALSALGVPDFTGVSFNTAAQAIPIAIMWGTRRIAPQVIWQSDLGGLPPPSGAAGRNPSFTGPDVGGNGYNFSGHFEPDPSIVAMGAWLGSVEISGGTYNGFEAGTADPGNSDSRYWRPAILALCEGPINSVNQIWNDSGTAPVPAVFPGGVGTIFGNWSSTPVKTACLFYTMFVGDGAQTAWGYFQAANTAAPGSYTGNQDLAYRQTAYLASALVDTGHGQNMPNQSFEIVRTPVLGDAFLDSYHLGVDYLLSTAIVEFLTGPQFGMGLLTSDIDSASLLAWRQYLCAQGLFHSPLLDSQTAATDIIDQWAIESNTWIYWDGTILRFAPLGDEALTANGQTYTPDPSPAYNLGPGDFLEQLQVDRPDPVDCYNRVRIEISDRLNAYAKNPIEWKDETLIGQFGILDASDVSCDDICDEVVGARVAELLGKRIAYVRNIYTFTVSYRFIRCLPGTIVTLTDANLGLSALPVRIRTIQEDNQGRLAMTAEEFTGAIGICRSVPPQQWIQKPGGGGAGGTGGTGTGGTSVPPVIGPISAPVTTGPADLMTLIQAVAGGYTITLGPVVGGVIYRWVHVGGAAGTNLFETSTQNVTLSRGANTFTIEDPQDRFVIGNTAVFATSKVDYEYWLDTVFNVFRCVRQVR